MDTKRRSNKKENANEGNIDMVLGKTPGKMHVTNIQDTVKQAEILKLRQEHKEVTNDNKNTLARL